MGAVSYCEKYKCTLTPELCARRHDIARETTTGYFEFCRDCETGAEAFKEYGHADIKVKRHSYQGDRHRPRFKCPKCGVPVTAKTLCVKCKLDREKKEEEAMETISRKCSVAGCDRHLKSKGLCNKHYMRQLKDKGRIGARSKGDVRLFSGESAVPEGRQCSVTGCGKYAVKGGMCTGHYKASKTLSSEKPGDVAGRSERVGSHKPGDVGSTPIPATNGKALLGQLLYASDLLDKQINAALETGAIDTAIILDIRQRVGAVLQASIDVGGQSTTTS